MATAQACWIKRAPPSIVTFFSRIVTLCVQRSCA